MAKFEMTDEKKKYVLQLITWYWLCKYHETEDYITQSDYRFLYSLWSNSLQAYDDKIQERLNEIVNIYNKNKGIWKKVMKDG